MKFLVLAAAIAAVPAGQGAGPQATGSWTAEFKGETFVRLEIRAERGTLGGSMSAGNIEVDEQGGLRRVTAAPGDPSPIFDVVQQGSTVTFSRKDVHDTDRFELRLLDAGRAELRFLFTDEFRKELAADGIPVPKPIALTRR
jgi:hypothetical protein